MHMIRFLRGNMKEISRRLPSLLEPSCRKLLTTIIQAFEKMRGEWRLNLPADLLIIALEPDWGRNDSAWRPYFFFLSGFLGTRVIQRGEAKIMAFVRAYSGEWDVHSLNFERGVFSIFEGQFPQVAWFFFLLFSSFFFFKVLGKNLVRF